MTSAGDDPANLDDDDDDGDDQPEPEELVGKDEIDEADEMELDGDDLAPNGGR